MNDAEILKKIKAGDELMLEKLYRKYYRTMRSIVISNNGSEDEAQDVYQDALLIFWQKVIKEDFVLTSKISTYLYGICLNLWKKEITRRGRDIIADFELEYDEQHHEENERKRVVQECLDALGGVCKKILMYHYFDGLDMNSIAKKMRFANANTVKTRKYKCKKRLDNLIKSKYATEDLLH